MLNILSKWFQEPESKTSNTVWSILNGDSVSSISDNYKIAKQSNLFIIAVGSGSSLGNENLSYCTDLSTVFEMPYGSSTFTRLRKIKSVLINILIKDDSNDAFWQMTHSLR